MHGISRYAKFVSINAIFIQCSIWQNVFWGLDNSDTYQALSFDRLHAFHLGLFEDHIWSVLKGKIKAAGQQAIKKVDDQ